VTVSPDPPEVHIALKSSLRVSTDHAKRLTSLIEARDRTAEWHPLVSRVSATEAKGSDVLRSPQEWEGIVAGIRMRGVSTVTVWEPGKEYAFLNTDNSTGLSVESRFVIDTKGDESVLTASASFNLPREAAVMVNQAEVSRFFADAVEKALSNIAAMATEERASTG
jgi:hypothetical protein